MKTRTASQITNRYNTIIIISIEIVLTDLLRTSSGCILQLCKVSSVLVHPLRRGCAYKTDRHMDEQGDSYKPPKNWRYNDWISIVRKVSFQRFFPRFPLKPFLYNHLQITIFVFFLNEGIYENNTSFMT